MVIHNFPCCNKSKWLVSLTIFLNRLNFCYLRILKYVLRMQYRACNISSDAFLEYIAKKSSLIGKSKVYWSFLLLPIAIIIQLLFSYLEIWWRKLKMHESSLVSWLIDNIFSLFVVQLKHFAIEYLKVMKKGLYY